ncbi:hypothetical protein GCM10011331_10790 [Flavimobilis marinus]|uniref:Uncharacterized protein n=1 Tax=Flavimobilis marinus TaxID=285351 RepID=A0A1I2HR53_9MICO|nr:hypothetical protein [Flavimobilis marinus]GHG48770.1 hypothetical protein GCM10011331_10790 [Flavimobilis marinus]SFF32339.1 hypothetical protein SAMN04488035_2464 [Flavimobilis marinus]
MADALHVVVDGEHVRRSFGMLTSFILAPDMMPSLLGDFAGEPVEERLCLLASSRTIWHIFAQDAATVGAYPSFDDALAQTRDQADADYAAVLPGAVSMARALDEALALRGSSQLPPTLVDQIGADPAAGMGALGYYLRAASLALCACAVARRCEVGTLLSAVGQRLALAT